MKGTGKNPPDLPCSLVHTLPHAGLASAAIPSMPAGCELFAQAADFVEEADFIAGDA